MPTAKKTSRVVSPPICCKIKQFWLTNA